jgi:hypothetical protein
VSHILQSDSFLCQKNGLDAFHDAANKFRQLNERWDNRFTFHGQSLIEQYQQGRITLVCDLDISVANASVNRRSASGDGPSSDTKLLASLVFSANIVNSSDLYDWKQKPVLVENVEIVQGPDGVIPSLVRFYDIHDEVTDCFGGLGYYSGIYGGCKFIPGFSNRKSSVVIPSPEPAKNYTVDGKIERCLEIVEGISNHKREIVWKGLHYLDVKQIISSLRIMLDTETVRITREDSKSVAKVI